MTPSLESALLLPLRRSRCLDQAERIFQIADRFLGRDVLVPVSPDPEDCVEGIEKVRTVPPSLGHAEKIMIASNNETAVVGSPAAIIGAYNNFAVQY